MMKDSEILRKAKNRVLRGSSYICWAIDAVPNVTHDQRYDLKKWVMYMLDGYTTYESWLCGKQYKSYSLMVYSDFRKGRLAWLDWMIAYCEKEEAEQASKPIILNKKSRPIKELQ